MVAGFNIKVSVWRVSFATADDEVGGAITTGTYVYTNIPARPVSYTHLTLPTTPYV